MRGESAWAQSQARHQTDDQRSRGGNGHANGQGRQREAEPAPISWNFAAAHQLPTLSWWLDRELPGLDHLLGEFISTTSRILLNAPTGLGKTNFAMALAISIATGLDFLHWRAARPARVLYIDGEMPARLIKRRLADAARRRDSQSDNLVLLSREDYPEMPPLNTPEGQQFIDQFIAWAGPADEAGNNGFDFVVFDNIQALLTGDMKDPEQWAAVLAWSRDLTKRKIGQMWVHHTGLDETHGYGDKSREWGLDTVLLLEKTEQPDCDIAFNVKFTKARERTPENRNDFEPALITLGKDEWTSVRGGGDGIALRPGRGRPAKLEDIAMRAFDEAVAADGHVPRHDARIPPDRACITRDLWWRYFQQRYVGDADPKSVKRAFRMYADKLQAAERIGGWDPWIWRNK